MTMADMEKMPLTTFRQAAGGMWIADVTVDGVVGQFRVKRTCHTNTATAPATRMMADDKLRLMVEHNLKKAKA